MILQKISAEWKDSIKQTVKESTYLKYDTIIRKHILSHDISTVNISNLTTKEIHEFSEQLCKEGLSAKTVNDILVVLGLILKYAEDIYKISKPKIKYIKVQKKELRVLSSQEQMVLERFLLQEMDSYKLGILIALYTGMVVSGIFMITAGYNQELRSDFTGKYSKFIDYSDTGKDPGTAESLGMDLLNNDSYDAFLTNTQKAQIAHRIGESFYNDEDFYNAAHYFHQAAEFDANEIYSRDLIISLLRDGREEEAETELERISAIYPSSAVIVIADAQLKYERGEYMSAIETVDSNAVAFNGDSENLYSLFIIKGDSLRALGKYGEAANEYERARECKETVAAIRKQGDAYIKAAMKTGSKTDNRSAFL